MARRGSVEGKRSFESNEKEAEERRKRCQKCVPLLENQTGLCENYCFSFKTSRQLKLTNAEEKTHML